MAKWWVVVKEPAEAERRVELTGSLTFGRHPQTDCVLKDPTVSAHHAQIVERDGEPFILDLGSGNKTVVVDGPALAGGERHALGPGMVVQLGKTLLTFSRESDEASADAATTVPALESPKPPGHGSEAGGAGMTAVTVAGPTAIRTAPDAPQATSAEQTSSASSTGGSGDTSQPGTLATICQVTRNPSLRVSSKNPAAKMLVHKTNTPMPSSITIAPTTRPAAA